MNKYSTKYPVILVHGIIAKDFSFYRAFRKIKDKLALNHVHVYIGNHDGIGSIENNAKQLKAQIIEILKTEKVDKINIIAHSKGGLDSRYMISKLDMAKHVASLTTLSTPHPPMFFSCSESKLKNSLVGRSSAMSVGLANLFHGHAS